MLLAAAEDANRVVYLKAETDDDCIGMGTTLVGLILQGRQLCVVNVGTAGPIGSAKPPSGGSPGITRGGGSGGQGGSDPRAGPEPPQKNLITRALGTSRKVKADLFQETLEEGDWVLLCSDGLINEVTDQEIHQEILAGGTPQEICQRLVTRTLDSGAPDNVTVVLFQQ